MFYRDTLKELLDCFSKYEDRASKFPQYFEYGVQGAGIHLFDERSASYKYWVGGRQVKTIDDVIAAARQARKPLPRETINEYNQFNHIDAFISHKSEDLALAKKVYDLLVRAGFSVFLSEISLPDSNDSDYFFEIDKALENANNMVVIGSSAEKIGSRWVRHEWGTFIRDQLSEGKSGNLITVMGDGLSIEKLPHALRQFEAIPKKDIDNLVNYIKK